MYAIRSYYVSAGTTYFRWPKSALKSPARNMWWMHIGRKRLRSLKLRSLKPVVFLAHWPHSRRLKMADTILKQILARDPEEKEFHQTVKEFIDTINRITSYNVCYTKLLRKCFIHIIAATSINWKLNWDVITKSRTRLFLLPKAKRDRDMIIGVLKEIKAEENRVSLSPGGVEFMRQRGHSVLVQKNVV